MLVYQWEGSLSMLSDGAWHLLASHGCTNCTGFFLSVVQTKRQAISHMTACFTQTDSSWEHLFAFCINMPSTEHQHPFTPC